MEKVKHHVPNLRFPGYKGAWKNVSLEDATSKTISYGIVQAGEHVEDGMPYIKSIDLNEELNLDRLQRTSMAIAHKYRRSEVRPGDIVFSLRGNIGVSQIVPSSIEVANLTQGTARISVSKHHSNVFVRTALQTEKVIKHVLAVMKGSTFQEISLGDLREVEIYVPTLPEQQKIAAFLGAVDRKIQQLKRKQALLEQYKKGVVQQLFSQELRFKREDGGEFPEWEEKRLDAFVSEFIVPMRDKPKVLKGPIPWCRLEDFDGIYLSGSKTGQGVTEDVVKAMNLKIFPKGTLLVSCSANLGFCAITEVPLVTNQTFIGLVPDRTKVNTEFLYYLMLHSSHRLNTLSSGTTISYLSREAFEEFPVVIPSLEEQSRIAGFLMALDAKVAGVAQAVAAAERWKKGLLQQMFV